MATFSFLGLKQLTEVKKLKQMKKESQFLVFWGFLKLRHASETWGWRLCYFLILLNWRVLLMIVERPFSALLALLFSETFIRTKGTTLAFIPDFGLGKVFLGAERRSREKSRTIKTSNMDSLFSKLGKKWFTSIMRILWGIEKLIKV